MIQNGISSKLRRKASADPDITLGKLIRIAKSMELSEVQADASKMLIASQRKLATMKLIKNGTKINQERNEN